MLSASFGIEQWGCFGPHQINSWEQEWSLVLLRSVSLCPMVAWCTGWVLPQSWSPSILNCLGQLYVSKSHYLAFQVWACTERPRDLKELARRATTSLLDPASIAVNSSALLLQFRFRMHQCKPSVPVLLYEIPGGKKPYKAFTIFSVPSRWVGSLLRELNWM